jgi:hypothetical protein
VAYSPTKRGAQSPASQESKLLDLLRKAEIDAYALAHSYDIGGDLDHAWRLVSVGEYLRDAANQLKDPVHIMQPPSVTAAWGLKSRALSLRSRLQGPASANSGAAPLVPRRGGPLLAVKKPPRRLHSRR